MYYVCDLKVEETDFNKEGKIDYLRTEYFFAANCQSNEVGVD